MSDLTLWELRGPVRTLRTHLAEWNPETGDWWPLKNRIVAIFRADGQLREIEHHNPDGSVPREIRVYDEGGRLTEDQWWTNDVLTSRVLRTYDVAGRHASSMSVDAHGTERNVDLCRYDDIGRKTKVVFLAAPEGSAASCSTSSCGMHYGIEGTDFACSAPGATTSTTTYDDSERPSDVTFHDASNALVCRVVFSRDHHGRVQSERMQFDQATFFGQAIDVKEPADERESVADLLSTVFEDDTFLQATYAYDEKGRRIETVRRMGQLSEERMTCRYDDYDNPVEQVTLHLSREMRIDDGAVKVEEKASHVQRVRFEYQYDEYGNWTERIVWQRMEPNPDERPSNIERRTIEYFRASDGIDR